MIARNLQPKMSREEYDTLTDRVNFSSLKWLAKSPAHYRHHKKNPPDDTDAKKLGRAVHMAILEPERFLSSVAVWSGGRRAGKEWDAFCEKNVGRELLTERELAECRAMQQAVRTHEFAAPLLKSGQGEVTLLCDIGGFPAKGRIDFDGEVIVDLKTTRDASIEGFAKEAANHLYVPQAAWYSDLYTAATGKQKPYVIVSVENDPPYVVQVWEVSGQRIERGRRVYESWLDRLKYCTEQDWWPGYSAQVLDLTLPKWAEAERVVE